MAYPPRNFIEGYWYHVHTRGQRQEPLFFAPVDRLAYLSFLDRELSRRDGLLGSYCLMTNHAHLLIKMGTVPLDEIFQTAHMKYAKYFNRKRSTRGHVFQGRPGTKIVLDDAYCLQLVGYIHRNPMEAGLVEKAEEFEWSSWSWFRGRGGIDLASGIYPPGFKSKEREQTFQEMVGEELELEAGENYWGREAEWEKLERRREGREGRKYRERREWETKEEIARKVVEGRAETIGTKKGQLMNQVLGRQETP